MKIKLLLILQLIILNSVHSQNGNLDLSFGTNGIAITDVSNNSLDDTSASVIVKDNGSILQTGSAKNTMGNKDFSLVQYDSNGLLDTAFGTNGITILDINGSDEIANSSVLQSDGKIITVGYTSNTTTDIIVARFNSNGTLDTSYAINGIFTYNSGGDDYAKRVTILPDNKILIGCEISSDYGVIKISETGIIETSFGTNGIVTTDLGLGDNLSGLQLQSDGKILIVGTSGKMGAGDGDVYDKALIRYNSDGSLDTSFNATGIIFTSFENGKNDGGYSINIQSDGKIIVNGSSEDIQGFDKIALARYNINGSIDATFGTNGTTFTNYSDYDLSFTSLIQNDGKIIIGGYFINITTLQRDFILSRYNTNGVLDNTFGANGITTTDLNNSSRDFGYSLAFQTNNKILLAGYTKENGGTYDFAIARYTIEGNLGIDDFVNNSKNYLVYPNPATESISIINKGLKNDKVDIEIYSITGKKLKSITNYNLDKNISLQFLQKGVYLIKILNDRTSETLKIIRK
ncbi:T9SS type A sorting domain-containing protein [Polaribacter sp. Z014]|uniref:T9SS type A sorting domain-containing protein n=1 Tax=Polaribacter sp. Z014 TaxID=2927126 RepID=UPI0020202C09|nr:T9SS type A sorting domain-containing protein [Polaribacter sp. Z014]MCL7765366.1 T9SS type A sorting domain-containing protein [Polaribacter sp. Z014]